MEKSGNRMMKWKILGVEKKIQKKNDLKKGSENETTIRRKEKKNSCNKEYENEKEKQ